MCTACQRSKIDCVYPARTRLPRGKQGGFRARNAELSRRLNRLESLVGKLGVEPAGLLSDYDPEDLGDDRIGEQQQGHAVGIVKHYTSPTPRASETIRTSDGTQYMSSDFWSSLSKEVRSLFRFITNLLTKISPGRWTKATIE